MGTPLTAAEKDIYNILRIKAQFGMTEGTHLARMTLDGKDVAIIGCEVFNAFTGKAEGLMPLALLLTQDDPLLMRLRTVHGDGPITASPHDLDPNR